MDKVKAYFDLGVQSCWLVYPSVPAVSVYSGPKTFKSYVEGDIVDHVIDVQLPIAQLFN